MWEARETTPTASTMATQASATVLASPSSTPANENAMSQGANYFFGFLITFIILLLIFVACGVGTRRRTPWFTRGRRPNQTWDPVRDDPSLQPEPMLWEAWVVGGSPQWTTMMVSLLNTLIMRLLISMQRPVRWCRSSHYQLQS
jgi:hypothetical protein